VDSLTRLVRSGPEARIHRLLTEVGQTLVWDAFSRRVRLVDGLAPPHAVQLEFSTDGARLLVRRAKGELLWLTPTPEGWNAAVEQGPALGVERLDADLVRLTSPLSGGLAPDAFDGLRGLDDVDGAPLFLVPREGAALLQGLAISAWVRASDRRVFRPDECLITAGFGFRLGKHTGRLSDLVRAATDRGPHGPSRLRLIYDGWVVDDLHRLRPLIYFTVYGGERYYEMLRLAVDTLFRFSGLNPAILIMTGSNDLEPLKAALSGLDSRRMQHVRFALVEAPDLASICFSRFAISELAEARGYGPVVYMDADVLCDASLEPMAVDALLSDQVLAKSESSILHKRDYYGRPLFQADPTLHFEDVPAFSSGVMAARDLPTLGGAWDAARQVAEGWFRTSGRHFDMPDQAVANYAMLKLGLVNQHGLDPYVRLNGNKVDADLSDRRGLVHFCGGVGRSEPKIVRMRRYHALLKEASPPAA
jgi:hypothetical protein